MLANTPDGYTIVNVPVPFTGTPEEIAANYRTHHFQSWTLGDDFGDTRCSKCDCKPWHKAADYPCGTEPQRMVVITNNDQSWEIKQGEIPADLPSNIAELAQAHLNW